MTTPFRAKRYLDEAGIALSELITAGGFSKTTWSRLLAAKLPSEPAHARAVVEKVYSQRTGRRAPAGFWEHEPPAAATPAPHNRGDEPMMIAYQPLSPAAHAKWGFARDPFDSGMPLDRMFVPPSHLVIEQRLTMVMQAYGFVAVAGQVGSGKSTLYERARQRVERAGRQKIACVRPANVQINKLTSLHITGELIRQLRIGARAPSTAANDRDAFVEATLLEQHANGIRTVLVIDDAHRLPDNTLRDLKRYHEMRTGGFSRVLGIVLFGQPELLTRFEKGSFDLREVTQRLEVMELPSMSQHVAGYLAARIRWAGCNAETVFDTTAFEALERNLNGQQYPLVINNVAAAAMNIAAAADSPIVSCDEVNAVWSSSPAQLQAASLAGVQ